MSKEAAERLTDKYSSESDDSEDSMDVEEDAIHSNFLRDYSVRFGDRFDSTTIVHNAASHWVDMSNSQRRLYMPGTYHYGRTLRLMDSTHVERKENSKQTVPTGGILKSSEFDAMSCPKKRKRSRAPKKRSGSKKRSCSSKRKSCPKKPKCPRKRKSSCKPKIRCPMPAKKKTSKRPAPKCKPKCG